MNKESIFKINLLTLFLLASCTTPTTIPVASSSPTPTTTPSANSSASPNPSQSPDTQSSVNPSISPTPSATASTSTGAVVNTGTTLNVPSDFLKLSYYDYYSAELKWKEISGAKSYRIYQDGKVIADNLTSAIYYVKNLTPHTNYKFDIVAVNDAGESNKSTISMRTFIPSTPTNNYSYTPEQIVGPRDRSIDGVIFVDLSSTGGANNGTTWNNAYTNLQTALARTDLNGKQIWIAKGTYSPSAPVLITSSFRIAGAVNGRDLSFVIPGGVKVYGGFAGTELSIDSRTNSNTVTLSGDLNKNDNPNNSSTYQDNSFNVVKMENNTNPSTIDTLTITAGRTDGSGAGLYIESSSPVINKVIFSNNVSDDNGGAIYSSGISNIDITNSTFDNNESESEDGGAIYKNTDGNLNITNSIFKNNTTEDDGGAIYSTSSGTVNIKKSIFENNTSTDEEDDGGAIYVNNSINLFITDSKFNNNSSVGDGGAIYASSSGEASIINSQFTNNKSNDEDGGAIYKSGTGKLTVNNSTFTSNFSDEDGGAIYISDGNPLSISGSSFTSNSAINGGAIYYSGSNTLVLNSSIFSLNTATQNGNSIYIGYLSTLTQGTGNDVNTIDNNDIYIETP